MNATPISNLNTAGFLLWRGDGGCDGVHLAQGGRGMLDGGSWRIHGGERGESWQATTSRIIRKMKNEVGVKKYGLSRSKTVVTKQEATERR